MMNEEKNPIIPAKFQKWLLDYGVKISRIAELMGMKRPEQLSHSLNHTTPKGESTRRITPDMAARVNAVLPLLADEVRSLRIKYRPEDGKPGRNAIYFPSALEGIRAMRKTLQVKPFVKNALGWTETRYNSVLVSKVNGSYGNLTESDLTAINTALAQLAAALREYELMPDEPSSSSSSDSSC